MEFDYIQDDDFAMRAATYANETAARDGLYLSAQAESEEALSERLRNGEISVGQYDQEIVAASLRSVARTEEAIERVNELVRSTEASRALGALMDKADIRMLQTEISASDIVPPDDPAWRNP